MYAIMCKQLDVNSIPSMDVYTYKENIKCLTSNIV
jgi:hypothetical protein